MDKQHNYLWPKGEAQQTCIQFLTGHTCTTVEAEIVRKDNSRLGGWQRTTMPTQLCLTRLCQVLWCYNNLVAPVLGQPFIRPSPAIDGREHLTWLALNYVAPWCQLWYTEAAFLEGSPKHSYDWWVADIGLALCGHDLGWVATTQFKNHQIFVCQITFEDFFKAA